MYKLAVLDIDGTLVDDKGHVSKKTIQTIRAVHENGGIVTLCTGRNIRKTLPVVKEARIFAPIVCMDGTVLFDPKQNKILKDFQMSKKETFQILDFLKDTPTYVEIADGDKYFKYFRSKEYQKYDIFNKHDFWGKIHSYTGGIRYLKEFSGFKKMNGPFYQILVAAEEETTKEISRRIRQSGLDRVEIRDHLWRGYLFIHREGIKKSNGIKMLCDYFHIPIEEVVAIGDERNDLDMIEAAGMGIAMGNAVKSVKKAADDITLKNTEDGVAKALEKYFL